MNTLAELKRKIKVGTKIIKVDSCLKLNTIGQERIVDKVQKNAFTMNGSWLYWQKSSDYEIDVDTFSVFYSGKEHTHENLIGKYKIVEV